MSEFDFDDLRSLQRKERNIAGLAEADPELYTRVVEYLNKLIGEYKSDDLAKARMIENTVKVARDVFERRIQKIVMKSYITVVSGDYSENNMTREEARLYRELTRVLKDYMAFVDKVLAGEYPDEVSLEGDKAGGTEEEEKKEEMLINEQDKNIVLARVVKQIPRFVAPDGEEYGPYESGDIVRLPEEVANVLGEQGLLEIL